MRGYYIIGANRDMGDGSYEDVWEQMLAAKAVDIGFARNKDMTSVFGKPESVIYDTLKRRGESNRACRAHAVFLNLRPGDMVAIKEFASPKGRVPRLRIYGYAVVRVRHRQIYKHTKGRLPHQISVDFLQTGRPKQFRIGGYGQTIHRLTNPDHIRKVFEPILGTLSKVDQLELKNLNSSTRREVALKDVEERVYRINKSVTVSAKHNRLQNILCQRLVDEFGATSVLMEKDYVDIQVRIGNRITLYEVKPFDDPLLCLREALGQILLYGWRAESQARTKLTLVVVGPSKISKDAAEFLQFLRQRFGRSLEYLPLSDLPGKSRP